MSYASSAATAAIDTQGLCKSYGEKTVVSDLSLFVPRGEVFGFLGANGAGKSTTVKMLLGLVQPTRGRVSVLGGHPSDPAIRAKLGFLPEQFRFQTWMTAEEFLRFHGQLAGLRSGELRTRIPWALKEVGLEGRGGEQLSRYSKGMVQRCGLAGALLANPELVFLDEPTSALDPIGRVEVREIIERLRAGGTAVFLNSHLLSEVEQVCDRVAFIRKGQVVLQGSMQELTGGLIPVEIRLQHDAAVNNSSFDETTLREWLSVWGDVRHIWQHPSHIDIELWIKQEEALPDIARDIINKNYRLVKFQPRKPDLEAMFLELLEPAHTLQTASS